MLHDLRFLSYELKFQVIFDWAYLSVINLQISVLRYLSVNHALFFSRQSKLILSPLKKLGHGNLTLNFSTSSIVIRVNLLHPKTSLFLYGLFSSHWCFPILITYHFQVYFNFKVVLFLAKITQNQYRDWTPLNSFLTSLKPFQQALLTVILPLPTHHSWQCTRTVPANRKFID